MSHQTMIINAIDPEEFRIAIVEGHTLEGLFIETATRGKVVGNLYKGIITHIQPSLQAAFVNYGVEKNGFLPFSEIHPEYYDVEADESARIQDVMHQGQEVLVQVLKEEVGTKGALLTTYVSLAGRDIVLMPGQSQRGVSRKIEDGDRRERLKESARGLKVPEEFGVIIRTAAENRTKKEVSQDLNNLVRIWDEIKKKVQETPAPALIYKEQDLAIRVIRDYFNPAIKSILVDDKDVYRLVKEFLRIISPHQDKIVRLHKEEGPIFNKYGLEEQIGQIFRKKVFLKSGGYLLIGPTDALVAIDVNSGRSNSETALEETVYKVNMEAAAEVPRQLRLRDLGGLIVIDFIDMREARHMREVERRLKEEIKKDKAKITIGRISRFGLLEMSRQHLGLNILHGSYQECPLCNGAGLVRSAETTALSYLRKIWSALVQKNPATVKATLPTPVASYLLNRKRSEITSLEQSYRASIVIEGVSDMMPHEGHLEIIPREADDADRKPEDTKRKPESATPKAESGPAKPEGGARKPEGQGRKARGGRKPQSRARKPEPRAETPEARAETPGAGSEPLEDESRKPEVAEQVSETESIHESGD